MLPPSMQAPSSSCGAAPPPAPLPARHLRVAAAPSPHATSKSPPPPPSPRSLPRHLRVAGSSRGGRPPLPAAAAVSGKQLSTSGIVVSGELGAKARRGHVEGVKGSAMLPPGSDVTAMPGNAGHRKSAEILPEGAVQMFDALTVRDPSARYVLDVPIDDGNAWEKGPEKVLIEGSSIRTIFSSSSQAAPGAGGVVQLSPANTNVVHTRQLWAAMPHPTAPDTQFERFISVGLF